MLQYRLYLRSVLRLIGDAAGAGDFIVAVGGSRLAEIELPGTARELSARFLDHRTVDAVVEHLPDAELVALAGLISTWLNDGAARTLAEAACWTTRKVRVADIDFEQADLQRRRTFEARRLVDELVDHPTAIGWPSGVTGYRLVGSIHTAGKLLGRHQTVLPVCVPEVFTRTEGPVHAPPYGVGDRIAPGRWGRLTRDAGPEDRHFYRESVWEEIRLTSRLNRLTAI